MGLGKAKDPAGVCFHELGVAGIGGFGKMMWEGRHPSVHGAAEGEEGLICGDELVDVSPWHTVGQRRTLEDYGRVVERQLPDDVLRRMSR